MNEFVWFKSLIVELGGKYENITLRYYFIHTLLYDEELTPEEIH